MSMSPPPSEPTDNDPARSALPADPDAPIEVVARPIVPAEDEVEPFDAAEPPPGAGLGATPPLIDTPAIDDGPSHLTPPLHDIAAPLAPAPSKTRKPLQQTQAPPLGGPGSSICSRLTAGPNMKNAWPRSTPNTRPAPAPMSRTW